MPLSVDEKEVVLNDSNPVPGLTVKPLAVPHERGLGTVLCIKIHSLLPPPTLQRVIPFMSPVTVHRKVKVSPGHVGGAGMNCPATYSGENALILYLYLYIYVYSLLATCEAKVSNSSNLSVHGMVHCTVVDMVKHLSLHCFL